MNILHRLLVALAGLIALAGAAIHVGAVVGGPSWYAYFGAPPPVVDSAEAGTWLAPVSALAIAAAMAVCAAYAFSSLGWLRPLPLRRVAVPSIATLCLLRAFLLVPLAVTHPAVVTTFEVVAALVWGVAGAGFAVAAWRQRALARQLRRSMA